MMIKQLQLLFCCFLCQYTNKRLKLSAICKTLLKVMVIRVTFWALLYRCGYALQVLIRLGSFHALRLYS